MGMLDLSRRALHLVRGVDHSKRNNGVPCAAHVSGGLDMAKIGCVGLGAMGTPLHREGEACQSDLCLMIQSR